MTRGVRRAARLVVLVLAVLLLVRFARGVHWAETAHALRTASPVLVALATVLNFLSLLARGARWSLFLRAAGAPGLGLALRGAVVGSGLNNVLPANGGEAVRTLMLSRRSGVPTARIAATVALDRVVDLLVYLAMLALAPHLVPLPAMLQRWGRTAGIVLLVLIAIVVPLLVVAARRRQRAPAVLEPELELEPSPPEDAPLLARVRAQLANFGSTIAELFTGPRLLPALALSLVSWSLQVATYHAAARATGLPATVAASAAAMLAVNMTFFVQLTPGNVGIFQLVYALVMSAFGLDRAPAIAVAMLVQALQIVPVTAAALVLSPGAVRNRAATT